MANSNRTVWAARHQKFFATEVHVKRTRMEAHAMAEDLRKAGKRVRVTRFRVGPKTQRNVEYAVRVYEQA